MKRKLNPQPLIVESDRRTLICWLCTVTANVGTALHMHGYVAQVYWDVTVLEASEIELK